MAWHGGIASLALQENDKDQIESVSHATSLACPEREEKRSRPAALRSCPNEAILSFVFLQIKPIDLSGGKPILQTNYRIGDILMPCKMSSLSFLVSVCRCVDYCFRSLILCGVLHAHLNFLPQFPSSEIAAHEIGGLHPEPARHRQQP